MVFYYTTKYDFPVTNHSKNISDGNIGWIRGVMADELPFEAEKWQKDLAVYRDINTTFIVEGNVHDLQPWIYEDDGTCEPVALSLYLQRY